MSAPVPHRIGTGYRVPGDWAAGYHPGVDYLCPSGTPVIPGRGCRIVYAGWNGWGRAYGLTVIAEAEIDGKPFRAIFAHLQRLNVKTGDLVSAGTVIAWSNNTGRTSGPHLHEEVRHWPFSYGDDVNPNIWNTTAAPLPPKPKPGTVTSFEVSFWNIAAQRWGFGPWGPRRAGVAAELKSEAPFHGFAEIYDEAQAADLMAAVGPNTVRNPGHSGLEFMYDGGFAVEQRPPRYYDARVQGRGALVSHVIVRSTGQHVAFVVVHGPVQSDALKRQYGAWLARLLGQIDGPIVLMGDFNRSVDSRSPRKEIRAAGFRDMRELAAVTNEGADEFPSKGWNLSDIYVDRNDAINDTITGGQIDLTSPKLSDHRRIEATVKVTA